MLFPVHPSKCSEPRAPPRSCTLTIGSCPLIVYTIRYFYAELSGWRGLAEENIAAMIERNAGANLYGGAAAIEQTMPHADTEHSIKYNKPKRN